MYQRQKSGEGIVFRRQSRRNVIKQSAGTAAPRRHGHEVPQAIKEPVRKHRQKSKSMTRKKSAPATRILAANRPRVKGKDPGRLEMRYPDDAEPAPHQYQ